MTNLEELFSGSPVEIADKLLSCNSLHLEWKDGLINGSLAIRKSLCRAILARVACILNISPYGGETGNVKLVNTTREQILIVGSGT